MEDQQIIMLKKWRSRYKRAQLAHSYTAVSYGRYNFTLGIILIILTTASSVLIFSDFKCYFWLSPTVGVFAALFAYLQTFLSFSKNAEIHRVVERSYGALKKEVEYLINFNSGEDISKKVNDIREKENTLSSEAPHSLSYNWKKAKKETQDENDQYSIRTNT